VQVVVLEPSQAPAHAEPSDAHACLPPFGSPVVALQVPTWPTSAHDAHCPVHALSQHTPSTQKPLPHCASALQALAWGSLTTHMPAEHQRPAWQFASVVHVPLQAVAPQVYGAHAWVCAAGHEPCPSQVAANVAVAPVHDAARHVAVPAG
jgi:hypothetical protein